MHCLVTVLLTHVLWSRLGIACQHGLPLTGKFRLRQCQIASSRSRSQKRSPQSRARLPIDVTHAAVQEDMPYLHTALASASPELRQACLFPGYRQVAIFAEQHAHLDLSEILELFADRHVSSGL